jgi:DNA-binding LacI/PurR family transcriptional regulator
LTTVRQGLSEMGREAVRLLTSVLEAHQKEETFPPEVRWITPEVIIRESSNSKQE